jgi:predicted Zn-dependent protease
MQLDRLRAALARVRADDVGIRAWSVFATESRSLSLGIKDRAVGSPHAPLGLAEGVGARFRLIWEDGKLSRGTLERRQLEHAPDAELARARAAAYEDPDATQVLGPAALPQVVLFDERAAALADGDTTLLVRRLGAMRERVEDGRFRTWSGSFSAARARSRVITSSGLDAESDGTVIGWHASLDGEIGDGFSARAPESDAEFEARLDRLVQTGLRLQQPAGPVAGGVRPVLLSPRVVEEYVLDTLLGNLAGAAVAHGEGHFRREQFGASEPVLREDLSLRLDPLQPLKRGSYRFTSEGVPAAACAFIERGRLIRPTLDLKYARRLGLEPTPLPLGADTLTFEAGAVSSFDEAVAAAAGGAYVLTVLGAHTQDGASGDFSLSAPQALAIGARGLGGKLRATISGNLFAILASDALRFVRVEGEHTPGLLFPCRLDPR